MMAPPPIAKLIFFPEAAGSLARKLQDKASAASNPAHSAQTKLGHRKWFARRNFLRTQSSSYTG